MIFGGHVSREMVYRGFVWTGSAGGFLRLISFSFFFLILDSSCFFTHQGLDEDLNSFGLYFDEKSPSFVALNPMHPSRRGGGDDKLVLKEGKSEVFVHSS